VPSSSPIRNRAFWILHGLAPHGTIFIDRGASNALANKAGLLPVGVVAVEGNFAQQEAVRLVVVDKQLLGSLSPMGDSSGASMQLVSKGEEIGRAVVNYSAGEIARIKGMRSSEIVGVLGYADSEYVAYRENVSLHSNAADNKSRPETPSGWHTPQVKERTPESSIADLRIGQ
jgi:glutamate 5-kinase